MITNPITEKNVLDALGQVDDPDLKKDLVTLGMVKDIKIQGNKVAFTVVLTTPACPMKDAIRGACINAIHLLVSKEAEVEVNMTADIQGDQKNTILPNVKNIIAISSGKGGVGKSTIASQLAISLVGMGAKVGLVDADIYGPSIPIMFGFDKEKPRAEKIDGKDYLVPFFHHGVKLMSIGVLVPDDKALVWRGPMATNALKQLIFDTNWGEIDYLLIDLPPGTGDVHLTLVQALPVTGAVVITTPQKVSVVDARKGAEMFRMPQINVPILGVIENMSFFIPDDNPEKRYYLYGEGGGKMLAEKLDTSLLGQIPQREKIARNSDQGTPQINIEDALIADVFDQLARSLAQKIAIRNANQSPTEAVKITTT